MSSGPPPPPPPPAPPPPPPPPVNGLASGSSNPPGGPSCSGPRPPPAPPAAPPRAPPPRKRTLSATTFTFERSWPLCLSCHLSVLSRPSTKTWRPFARYSPHCSACFPQTSTSCHSVSSLRCWDCLSVQEREVAMRRLATAWPPDV